ncbi:MAG: hypothetical protein ACYC0H_14640 [Solirubrobacteraceae bacterium]
MSTTRMPAQAVNILRQALITELGLAAAKLEAATIASDVERYPQPLYEPLRTLDRCRAALDAIGWKQHQSQASITLQLAPHRLAILQALQTRLEVERDYLDVDPALPGAHTQRQTAASSVDLIETLLRGQDLAGARRGLRDAV